jgi:hypothetical protein
MVKMMSAPEVIARHGVPKRSSGGKVTVASLVAEEFGYLVKRERTRQTKARFAIARVRHDGWAIVFVVCCTRSDHWRC